MVAIIGSGISIRRAFLYNEHKLEKGVAKCLMAANYPIDLQEMNSSERLKMLVKTASLNPSVKRNCMHISLNFAPDERLSDEKLKDIASEYMQQIGFAGQPFLVYRHDDAGHPHIHIVSTNIRPDGTRIDTFNIGKLRSEPARKMLENRYGLKPAEQQKQQFSDPLQTSAAKVSYGQQASVKAISGVLQHVLQQYRYTSISELNAVLNLYHIKADSGSENSRISRHKGLVYRILDSQGKPQGVPIKASAIYNKPGLKFLEKQYLSNDVARFRFRPQLCTAIDTVLLSKDISDLGQFTDKLKTLGIAVVPRLSSQGQLYGITYVDHRSKCVFNGSALGKKYSAKSISEKLLSKAHQPSGGLSEHVPNNATDKMEKLPFPPTGAENNVPQNQDPPSFLETLMGYEEAQQGIPYQWRKKKKRKKKR